MKYFFQSISWNAYFRIVSLCKLLRNNHGILFEAFHEIRKFWKSIFRIFYTVKDFPIEFVFMLYQFFYYQRRLKVKSKYDWFMNEKDFNLDAATRLQLYQAQRRYGKLFLFLPFSKNNWHLGKQPQGAAMLKRCSGCAFDWKFEVFWIVKRRGALIKLDALLKICLFAWYIDLFWIIIVEQTQSTQGN